MRLSAGVLANAGRVQQARDLVEGALQAAGESAGRRRLAWSAMADVYHRVGNNLESLIALAAAAAGETEVDAQEMWHETECLVRVLRDLGLYDLARQEHQNAETLLRQLGYWDANQHRHVLTALQVDMAQLVHGESRDAAELHRLMIDVAAVGREVLAREDDPTVPAVMLGQLIRFAHQDGVPAPPEADAVLQLLLQHAGTSAVELVRSASSQHVTAEDLLRVYQRTEPARYADDVAFDLRHAVLAARRLLNDDDAESDSVCLAIEVLADRAIAIPGWQATARPAAPIADIHSPAAAAKAFSMQGLSVVLAALDGDGRLVSVTATGGHLGDVRCESEALFSAGALRSWAEQFPRCYGIDDAANLFFTSTERLRLSALPPDPTLLVAEPDLQQIPPNLWRVNDEFAGLARPMAAAPSLSWLEAASNRSDTSGRKVAWISTESQHGQTLATLADRLRPTFVEHGIRFDTSAILPEGYAGADLVVVAAHGGLHAEGRFFQRVSDEGSLTVGSHEFARALRNIGVVILFVCSGGRLDRHPGANTTIGLVSQVLHQGCSAVVASPWPLDARVTYHWFPAFMRAWKDGAPLIDANFQANGAVGRAFGNDLAKCLAMNVYGDPLKRFTG
jgi:tetratricopeptide (TPR) repeat protein